MSQANVVKRIDVRTIAPVDRHTHIFKTFEALKAGEAMELVNERRPSSSILALCRHNLMSCLLVPLLGIICKMGL